MISVKDLQHNITEAKVKDEPSSVAASREPSPNRGSSMPDFQAIGPESQSKTEWLASRNIDVSQQVKISKLSHMRYQHPDLKEITTFLRDFGMHVVKKTETQRWFSGYGPDQYVYYAQQGPMKFLGGTFEVQSYEDLEKAVRVPGAKVVDNGIREMTEAPGGGHIVTIEDPEGFLLNFIFGQKAVDPSMRPAPASKKQHPDNNLLVNDEYNKPRQRKFQRFEPGPAAVFKLGHFGLNVENFPAQMDWYTRYFNIVPSDILYVPDPAPSSGGTASKRMEVAIFAHINLDSTLTDHHTLFLTSLDPRKPEIKKHVHHSSYEVHDLDTQFLGHQWLTSKKYKSVWGVGRHILGSQIFDYWWDTTGFMVEHYADGDLVNMNTPVGFGPAGHEGLAVWGPEVPGEFLD